jgi:hypothetical protein
VVTNVRQNGGLTEEGNTRLDTVLATAGDFDVSFANNTITADLSGIALQPGQRLGPIELRSANGAILQLRNATNPKGVYVVDGSNESEGVWTRKNSVSATALPQGPGEVTVSIEVEIRDASGEVVGTKHGSIVILVKDTE